MFKYTVMIGRAKMILRDISAEMFQVTTWIVIRIAFAVFGKLTVTGVENLDKERGAIILAPNHANDMDPIFMRSAMRAHSRHTPVYFVTYPLHMYPKIADNKFKKILYSLIPFGIIGAVPFKKGSGDYGVTLSAHINLLKSGRSVCIFPEGRVTQDGNLGEARGGVAYMSEVANTPVIPVTIYGTFKLGVKDFFTGGPNVRIHFGEALRPGDFVDKFDLSENRYKKAASEIMSKIGETLNKWDSKEESNDAEPKQ